MSFPEALVPDPPVTAGLAGRPSVLDDALAATSGPRQAAYGPPAENWARTAELATAILGKPMSARDCVRVAIAMKLARLRETPDHRDSLVDLAGYAWVWSEVEGV